MLLVVVIAAAGIFLYSAPPSTVSSSTGSSSQSSSGGGSGPFKVNYDTLTVGYNSGLWEISVQDVSGKQVKLLTAILSSPTESKICTGVFGGFNFGNCPATPPTSGAFAANANFTGYASGVGPGSATPGKSYPVTLQVVYNDGTALNQTLTVTATSSAGG